MKLPSLASENASQLRQIVDTTKCNLEALKAMKHNTDSWDMIIIYTLVQKLENKTKKDGKFIFPTRICQPYSSYIPFWNIDVMPWKAYQLKPKQMD